MDVGLRAAKLIASAVLAGAGLIAVCLRGSSGNEDPFLLLAWAGLLVGTVGLARQ